MAADAAPHRSRKYHHGDLREALLRAAQRELAEKGLESFTLRGVAKRAGVSHAAPAHHFRDTNALLTALVTVAMQRFGSAMTAAMAQAGDDARARFVAAGIAYVEFALENPSLFDLIFSSRRPDFDDPELNRQAATAFGSLVDGIAALIGADPMASPGGRLAVAAAWSQVHGVATLLNAGKMNFLAGDLAADRKAALHELVSSVLPVAPTSAD